MKIPGPRSTVRRLLVAVVALGLGLGWVANERWRWGYPRPVRYDSETALDWLATVIRSDFRMYDLRGVESLMNEVVSSGRLLGKSRSDLEKLLGLEDNPGLPHQGPDLHYTMGTVPNTMHAGPPTLVLEFDDSGRCRKVIARGGE